MDKVQHQSLIFIVELSFDVGRGRNKSSIFYPIYGFFELLRDIAVAYSIWVMDW